MTKELEPGWINEGPMKKAPKYLLGSYPWKYHAPGLGTEETEVFILNRRREVILKVKEGETIEEALKRAKRLRRKSHLIRVSFTQHDYRHGITHRSRTYTV